MTTCPDCTTPIADDATTCVVCGTVVAEQATTATAPDDEDDAMTTDTDTTATDTADTTPTDAAETADTSALDPAPAWPSSEQVVEPAGDPDDRATVATSTTGPGVPPPPPTAAGGADAPAGGDDASWPVVPASPRDGASDGSGRTPPSDDAVLVGESARNWALLAHVSGIVASSLVGMGFLGPLLVWILKRDDDPFVAQNASEALNFQLSMLLYGILLIVASLPVITLIATVPLALVGFALWLILPIVAAVRSSRGEAYTYPITIGFVRP